MKAARPQPDEDLDRYCIFFEECDSYNTIFNTWVVYLHFLARYHDIKLEGDEWDALELPPAAVHLGHGGNSILRLAQENREFGRVMENYVSSVQYVTELDRQSRTELVDESVE